MSEKDVFRDTPVRYLGYANEVGESFRALIHINVVRASYLLASAYVCADAYHKGDQARQLQWASAGEQQKKVQQAVLDTFVWQGLASVIIPGFTINRMCYASGRLLGKLPMLPAPIRAWTVTAIGLGAIPFIIKPIDGGVDWLMDKTVRKWYGIESKLENEIVHHHRDD